MTNDSQVHIRRISQYAAKISRPIRLMEVCGTHTHAIGRGGLRKVMPENIELVSGPGCPVCVTSQRDVERMLALAKNHSLTICTFGDMLRVPGITSSLEKERSCGADIRVVYSPLNVLDMAIEDPNREFVFLAVGFETTSPGVASVVLQAKALGLMNISIFPSHKLIIPAMEAVLRGECLLDGFLTPGHVSVIIGTSAYEELSLRYSIPCVATGFDPSDVLEGISMLLDCLLNRCHGSFLQYSRAVRPEGNTLAWNTLMSVFDVADAEWRGLGVIPASGLKLKDEYLEFDAVKRYSLPDIPAADLPGCRCGEILKGLIKPQECGLFGNKCSPRTPLGPCMVSSEGSCAARYKYG